ncbi:Excinuclease ABC C subunit [Lasiodiplodia theobromae]|nr:Excinuclease ABC C subunit [Lasiodiplodia theobromae]
MEKPIPAFYCCYLLRSTVRRASLYVGSTPNPLRRLRQHNGQSKGGAARTDRDSLRPWEMVCIVAGFPSKIAALQFEWAWQNTHLTRHIPAEDRITSARTTSRTSGRTGKTIKRIVRRNPPSLTDRLSNLHLLLRVKSFERWPLRVAFFAEDVYHVWEKWTKSTPFKLRGNIRVELEKASVPKALQRPGAESTNNTLETIGNGKGIEGIDVSYEGLKAYLEKSTALSEEGKKLACAICDKQMQMEKCVVLVCPEEGCQAISHMTCLSETFLKQEGKPDAVVPLQGQCPSCKKMTQWSTLVKELSLRIRGEKEVATLFKKRTRRAASPSKATAAALNAAVALEGDASSDDESEYADIENYLPRSGTGDNVPPYGNDEYEDIDDWYHQGLENQDDVETDTDTDMDIEGPEKDLDATATGVSAVGNFSPIVVEDSEWDDAEEVD